MVKTKLSDVVLLMLSAALLFLIVFPVVYLLFSSSIPSLGRALKEGEVLKAIGLSLFASAISSAVTIVLGTPLAWILSRKNFRFKKFIESIIDIPMVIPHPVIGIAILAAFGRNTIVGKMILAAGFKIMGSLTGIVMVMIFVGSPYYINACRDAFNAVPKRIEHVSRSLGAGGGYTFFLITLPLSLRSILTGVFMSTSRAISEFGAIVIVAYHPMVAPVLIFERFESYGLESALPIAVILIIICLVMFILLRILVGSRNAKSRKFNN